MEFQENILGLIGNTPLVKLNRLARNVKAQVYAKMENLNPGYSVKDRIGVAMMKPLNAKGLSNPAERSSKRHPETPVSVWRSPPQSKVTNAFS